MKSCRPLCLALLCAFALSGCALLPAEEDLPQAPTIGGYQSEDFTLCYVLQGDLVQAKKFNATYSAVREERLSFPIGGELFKDIYVEVGDAVTKGQLLAELDQSNIQQQLTDKENEIANLHLSIRQTKQDRDLAVEEQRIRLSFIEDEEELEEATTLEEVEHPYAVALAELQDRLRIAGMELEALCKKQSERMLIAGMDGTVSYLRNISDTDLSVQGENVITISDSASSMFVVSTKEQEFFSPGLSLTILVNQEEIPVTVVDSSTLEGVEPEEDTVYLLPVDAALLTLEDGDMGSLTLELARQENCLYLNSKAVKTMNGESFVYYQDENGLRSMKQVVTGFEADGFVEIVEGLSLGEAVILN